MISRRDWLRSVALAAAGGAGAAATLFPASDARAQDSSTMVDSSNLFAMDQGAARSVRLPAKPGASAAMTPAQRDELEHQIRCQCGCTLSVYTCRTTDFSCQVSPAMHRDVLALVDGGYDAGEILDAFVNVYGDRALMAPPRVGFNVLGYVLPGLALAVGAVLLAVLIRRWQRPAAMGAAGASPALPPLDATPEELARLDEAVRNDA